MPFTGGNLKTHGPDPSLVTFTMYGGTTQLVDDDRARRSVAKDRGVGRREGSVSPVHGGLFPEAPGRNHGSGGPLVRKTAPVREG